MTVPCWSGLTRQTCMWAVSVLVPASSYLQQSVLCSTRLGDCWCKIKFFFLHSAINQIAVVWVFDLILQSSEGLKNRCLKHLLLKYSRVFLLSFFILFHPLLQYHDSLCSWFSCVFLQRQNYSDPDAVWAQPQIVCLSFFSLSHS